MLIPMPPNTLGRGGRTRVPGISGSHTQNGVLSVAHTSATTSGVVDPRCGARVAVAFNLKTNQSWEVAAPEVAILAAKTVIHPYNSNPLHQPSRPIPTHVGGRGGP